MTNIFRVLLDFEGSEDIITKFKSQGLYPIRIKHWNASGSDPPPSLIPALWNLGILHYKQAKLPKHLQNNSVYFFSYPFFKLIWKTLFEGQKFGYTNYSRADFNGARTVDGRFLKVIYLLER